MARTKNVYEYIHTIEEAVEEWKQTNNTTKIKRDVAEQLSKAKNQVMLQLLGFDKDGWKQPTYRIDHCNGRAGNSIMGDYIQSNVKEAVTAFLSDFPLELSDVQKKELKAEVHSEFSKKLYQSIRTNMKGLIATRIKEIEKEYLDAVLEQYGISEGTDPIKAYQNMLKLIGAEDKET